MWVESEVWRYVFEWSESVCQNLQSVFDVSGVYANVFRVYAKSGVKCKEVQMRWKWSAETSDDAKNCKIILRTQRRVQYRINAKNQSKMSEKLNKC